MSTPLDILLIEDNPHDAELVIRALSSQQLTNHLIHIADGQSALDFFFGTGIYQNRNFHEQPKVVFLDLKLPKIDGLEVLRRIKSHESTKLVTIVILTSSREDKDIQRCYQNGANSYIVKPVEFDTFMTTIQQAGLYWMNINVASKT